MTDTVPVPAAKPVEVAMPRKLSGDALISGQVDRILASMPKDAQAVVIDVGADKDGIKAVVAANLGNGWTVFGELDRRFSGEWSGHAQIRKAFK